MSAANPRQPVRAAHGSGRWIRRILEVESLVPLDDASEILEDGYRQNGHVELVLATMR